MKQFFFLQQNVRLSQFHRMLILQFLDYVLMQLNKVNILLILLRHGTYSF